MAWGSPLPFAFELSAPTLIACFGLPLLLVVYLMDQHYYLTLLYGANNYVYKLEEELSREHPTLAGGVRQVFDQSSSIRRAFRPASMASTDSAAPAGKVEEDPSRKYVTRCYRLVAAIELVVITILAVHP
jgi:hypothetical protein